MICNYGPAGNLLQDGIWAKLEEIQGEIDNMAGIGVDIDQITATVSSKVKGELEDEYQFSSLTMKVNGIESTVHGITEEGGVIDSKITQSANNLTISFNQKTDDLTEKYDALKVTVDNIKPGENTSISWADLDDNIRNQINTAKNNANSALNIANDASDDAGDAIKAANDANSAIVRWTKTGSTYIDGKMIATSSLYADKIHLGGDLIVYTEEQGTTSCGYLGGTASAIDNSPGVHFLSKSRVNEVAVTNNGARLASGSLDNQISIGGTTATVKVGGVPYYFQTGYFRSDTGWNGAINLGSSVVVWNNVYTKSGNATQSDRNQKNNIEELDDRYLNMFDSMSPKRYKLNNGESGRYHVGFIAQEIEDAMSNSGIDSMELGCLIKDKNDNGDDIYLLRYEEFIGILTAKIKQLDARVKELEEK